MNVQLKPICTPVVYAPRICAIGASGLPLTLIHTPRKTMIRMASK
jgi:hypothetical protein